MDGQARLKLFKGSESVLVKVGPTGDHCWTLPKGLLVAQSQLFKAALCGEWEESTARAIELPEEEPLIFEYFVTWLYTERFDKYHEPDATVLNAAEIYLLGDRFGCSALRDDALNYLIESHSGTYLTLPVIEAAFKRSPPSSKLRRFVLVQFSMDTMIGNLETDVHTGKFDDALSSIDEFGVELTLLLPRIHPYLAAWHSKDPSFEIPIFSYVERVKLLVERNPTKEDLSKIT